MTSATSAMPSRPSRPWAARWPRPGWTDSVGLAAPVDGAAVLQRAAFDLQVAPAREQIAQGQHLPGGQQGDAEAHVEARRELLAHADHAAAQRARVAHAGVVQAQARTQLRG